MGSQTRLSRPRGANDQAQGCEGAAAVSDAGAVSPAGAGICMAARASGRWPALWNQCPDDSAVAEALAARGRRGAGAVLSSAPGAAGPARVHRADPPCPPRTRLRGGARAALAAAHTWDPASHGHDSTGVSRRGPAPAAADPQAGTPADETI